MIRTMAREQVELAQAYRTTPTGLYLFTSWADGHPNVQFAFRGLGIQDDPPYVLVGVQHKNYSLNAIRETGEFGLNTCSQEQVAAIDAGASSTPGLDCCFLKRRQRPAGAMAERR